MDLKVLNRKIATLGKHAGKLRDEVQLVAIGCLFHAFTHQNVDPATRLLGVLKGTDLICLTRWLEDHGPCIWVKSEAKFRHNASFKGEYDALALMASPWYEKAIRPDQVPEALDCMQAVRDLIKRIEREIAAGKREVQHKEVVDELKSTMGKLAMAAIKE